MYHDDSLYISCIKVKNYPSISDKTSQRTAISFLRYSQLYVKLSNILYILNHLTMEYWTSTQSMRILTARWLGLAPYWSVTVCMNKVSTMIKWMFHITASYHRLPIGWAKGPRPSSLPPPPPPSLPYSGNVNLTAAYWRWPWEKKGELSFNNTLEKCPLSNMGLNLVSDWEIIDWKIERFFNLDETYEERV